MKRAIAGILFGTFGAFAGMFDSGTKSLSVTVGSGSGFDTTYTIVGVSVNYFALNGLSAGIGYRGWFGGTPTMSELDLPVTYYLPLQRDIRPYAGGFYRHTFISGDYTDYDTYGARAGIAYVQGRGFIAAGWVQEWYSSSNGDDSSRGYPEISGGVSF